MIMPCKEFGVTYYKSTKEATSTGRMRKLSNYYEGEKGPYYGSNTRGEMLSVPVGYFGVFSGAETSLELLPPVIVAKPEISIREEIRLKRLDAAKRMDDIRSRIGPVDITAAELIHEGRIQRQEELFGKSDD